MKLNITDIIKVNGASMDVDFNETIEGLDNVGNGLRFDQPVKFSGKLVNNSGILELEGRMTTGYTAQCFRCLTEIAGKIDIKVDEDFVNSSSAKKGEDEVYTYEGNVLEIDKALKDNIVLNTPMKMVCSENCRGLCPKCGANLNEKECGCKEDTLNPHMAVLKDYLKNN